MIEDQIPEEAVIWMSMMDPILNDREWLEAILRAVKAEEDNQECRKLKNNYSPGSPSSGK